MDATIDDILRNSQSINLKGIKEIPKAYLGI